MKMSREVLQGLAALLYKPIQPARVAVNEDHCHRFAHIPASHVRLYRLRVGIFDFHADEGSNHKTVSKYWPIYVAACLVLTVCASIMGFMAQMGKPPA